MAAAATEERSICPPHLVTLLLAERFRLGLNELPGACLLQLS